MDFRMMMMMMMEFLRLIADDDFGEWDKMFNKMKEFWDDWSM